MFAPPTYSSSPSPSSPSSSSSLWWILTSVLGSVALIMFFVLVVLSVHTRDELSDIQKKQWAEPDELLYAPNLARVVRSYAVRIHLDATQRLAKHPLSRSRNGAPVMRDNLRAVCADGRDHSVPVVYTRVWWVAVARDAVCDALYSDILAGHTSHAALAGATVRIIAVEDDPALNDLMNSVLTHADQQRVRVFMVAPIYAVRRQDGDEVSWTAPSCGFDASLALPSDPARLDAWLQQSQAGTGGEARAHLWGWGSGR